MEKIKVGDMVKSKYGQLLKVLEVGRDEDEWTEDPDIWLLCESVSADYLPPMWYKLDELETNISKKSCECGAHADRHFPNIHSTYCPKYKEIK